MTRAPRLSARMRALEEAAQIAEERARRYREAKRQRHPEDFYGAHEDDAVAAEADFIARMIRERMQNRRART